MTTPIVTVTLNPAIDQTITVERLTLGTVHRARASQKNPGGKGVNVAGCLADWGASVAVTGVLGRDNAAPFEAFFATKGIVDHFVRVPGETRTNIKIADIAAHDTTDINLPGLVVDAAALDALWQTLRDLVTVGTPMVIGGSLPESVDAAVLTRLVVDLVGLGARVVLDTSGAPLRAALALPPQQMPHCVKPNRVELEEWAGRKLVGEADLVAAARGLIAAGLRLVVVSCGAEGALFVDAEQALFASLPAVAALSTVGAGDAMVAGIVAGLADDAGLDHTARLGVAFATAKLGGIGPHLPSIATVKDLAARVSLRRPEANA